MRTAGLPQAGQVQDEVDPSLVLRQTWDGSFDHILCSRLNDERTGCIILIMQRLHEDELGGHVLEREGLESSVVSGDRPAG